jgi:hypothetical protein
MDWEGWIFTAALVFCLFAMARCEPYDRNCDIRHPAGAPSPLCESYK